jgi:hypothetical protein
LMIKWWLCNFTSGMEVVDVVEAGIEMVLMGACTKAGVVVVVDCWNEFSFEWIFGTMIEEIHNKNKEEEERGEKKKGLKWPYLWAIWTHKQTMMFHLIDHMINQLSIALVAEFGGSKLINNHHFKFLFQHSSKPHSNTWLGVL